MVGASCLIPLLGAMMGALWAGTWAAQYGTVAALGGGAIEMILGLVASALYLTASEALTRANSRWPRWAVVTAAVVEVTLILSLGVLFVISIKILLRQSLLGDR